MLKDELKNDPAGIGYAGMNDAECAVALNAQTVAIRLTVASETLARHLVESGVWPALENAKASGDDNAALVMAAATVPQGIDLDAPKIKVALDALEGAAISQAERSAIDALADGTTSRAAQIGVGHVTEGDVQRARK